MATTSEALAGDQLQLADMRRRLKAIFIGSVGNLVEWYDFYAYAAFALYFASSFFPHGNPVVQQRAGARQVVVPVNAEDVRAVVAGDTVVPDPGIDQ